MPALPASAATALRQEMNPLEVIMAAAKPQPDFEGRMGGTGLEPVTSSLSS
jgi:hypothetical protein